VDIKAIKLEDFRSHEKIEVELAKVTVITGPNGSGKSSIIEAPATVLLGDNTWTARDGVKLLSQIRKGAKKARVTLVGKHSISRVISAKGSEIFVDDKESVTQAMIFQNLKANDQQLGACLIPHAFLNLALKEQREALFSLLTKKITLEQVGEFIPQDSKAVWNKLAGRWAEEHPDDDSVNLDKLYEFVYEARRKYKAKGTDEAKPEPPAKQKELVAELSEIQRQIAGANFENARVDTGHEMKAKLPDLKKRLAELEPKRGKSVTIQNRLQELANELLEAEKHLAGIEAVLREASSQTDLFEEVKFKKGKVSCPLGLECPHDEKLVKDKKAMAAGTGIAKEGERKSAREKVKRLRDEETRLEQQGSQLQEVEEEVDQLNRDIKHAEGLKEEEYVDVVELKEKKGKIEQELSQLTAPPPKTGGPDEAKVAALNGVVDALSVSGIKTQVVKRNIADLEKEVNEALAKFGEWRVRFFAGEDYRPVVLSAKGECQVGEMSDGERALLSLILQDVFSQRSGVNVVVMDNVDLLDQRACEAFINMACRVKSKVLVAMANTENLPRQDRPAGEFKIVNLGPSKKSKGQSEQTKKPAGDEGKPAVEDLI
jgi:DNA repair exonuclease SbcCD ATPase subunit